MPRVRSPLSARRDSLTQEPASHTRPIARTRPLDKSRHPLLGASARPCRTSTPRAAREPRCTCRSSRAVRAYPQDL
eukprot:12810092-Alexandrium_andersonii.AAC.1